MEGIPVKVSVNGQVSVPAAMRHRWGTSTMLVIDRGDYAIIRPVPEDPVRSLQGAYAGPGPDSGSVRAAEREAEQAADDRRYRQAPER